MKIIDWLKESNRLKHLAGGFTIGLLSDSNYCAALSTLTAAGCLEFKDKAWGGDWDWIDFAITVAGGVCGRATRLILGLIF
ncbi:MAG: hypothetical protein SNI49_03315 [Rikenellaceae bacterium]